MASRSLLFVFSTEPKESAAIDYSKLVWHLLPLILSRLGIFTLNSLLLKIRHLSSLSQGDEIDRQEWTYLLFPTLLLHLISH